MTTPRLALVLLCAACLAAAGCAGSREIEQPAPPPHPDLTHHATVPETIDTVPADGAVPADVSAPGKVDDDTATPAAAPAAPEEIPDPGTAPQE